MNAIRSAHVQRLAERMANTDLPSPWRALRELTVPERELFERLFVTVMSCHREALCADRFMSGRGGSSTKTN